MSKHLLLDKEVLIEAHIEQYNILGSSLTFCQNIS